MLNRQRKETQKELSKALKGFTEITPNMRKWTPNKYVIYTHLPRLITKFFAEGITGLQTV